ncbi:OB-fold domain-containing protein [Mycobacterium sp. ITM-2016-00317]|uniref:Zn-ribbon domain-containing OB-fold protein n=1 Tax=Mycobacterium sp. ITM-2016-00317 TaxID=2099694 RepID=UPI00287FBC21|nr:OB-fold domain-containing protein [Mycobacterium sp. ITM-2016-00317]WNG89271.1 OB-fold domain-containing protein [Mycobacterium sp. ITM-2016-00317]
MSTSPVSAKPPRILPAVDDWSRPYWTGGADGRLRIAFCRDCGQYVHPPRQGCPDCAGELEFVAVSGDATLFTYTVAHQQFHPDVPTPFVIAVVELAEQPGLRMVTNIVECDPAALVSGMPLRVRFERHELEAGAVFVPVFAPASPDQRVPR